MNSVISISGNSIVEITTPPKKPLFFLRMNNAAQPDLVVGVTPWRAGTSDAKALRSIEWRTKTM
jgi:hypothetical protein